MARPVVTPLSIPTPADLLVKQGWTLAAYLMLCAVLLTILWLVRRRGLNRSADPVCANCGYIASNLPGPMCPECGGNLAAAGIVYPGWTRSTEIFTHIVQWTILLPIAAFCITPLAWNFVRLREASQSVWLISRHESCSAGINARGKGYRSPLAADVVNVEMQRSLGISPFAINFSVNPRTMEYRATSFSPAYKGPRSGRLDQAAMLALMCATPSDPRAEEISGEAAALFEQIHAAAAQVRWEPKPLYFEVFNRSGSEGDAPHDPQFLNFAAGFCASVWAVGVVLILRRRRQPNNAAFRPAPDTVLARWRHSRQRDQEHS
ncbi:MAG: hypothetical protein JWP03_4528 [Phycisphaerales bacterium]|nr:hypothetical protein [Phycisphaerales bacterium]